MPFSNTTGKGSSATARNRGCPSWFSRNYQALAGIKQLQSREQWVPCSDTPKQYHTKNTAHNLWPHPRSWHKSHTKTSCGLPAQVIARSQLWGSEWRPWDIWYGTKNRWNYLLHTPSKAKPQKIQTQKNYKIVPTHEQKRVIRACRSGQKTESMLLIYDGFKSTI